MLLCAQLKNTGQESGTGEGCSRFLSAHRSVLQVFFLIDSLDFAISTIERGINFITFSHLFCMDTVYKYNSNDASSQPCPKYGLECMSQASYVGDGERKTDSPIITGLNQSCYIYYNACIMKVLKYKKCASLVLSFYKNSELVAV